MIPAKPRSAPRRRRHVLPVLLAVGLAALVLHGLAWRWMTGALAVGLSDWATMRRVEGWSIEHGPPARGGWPFAAELVVPGLRMEGHGTALAEAVAIESTRVVLRIAPPALDRLVVAVEGPQRLTLGTVAIPFAATRLEARLPLEPGPAPRAAEIRAEGLRAATPAGLFEARRAVLVLSSGAAGAEHALLVDLLAEGLRLPPDAADPAITAFGREVEAASLAAVLTGPPPAPPSAARAQAWRDAGGALDLRSLSLRWGPLAGEAQMRIGLDRALQPAGTGTLRIVDAPAAVAAMAAAGLITGGAARTAQGVVALTARAPPDGGPPRVDLPVAISEGRLSVARIPLLRFAPIAWPGMAPPR